MAEEQMSNATNGIAPTPTVYVRGLNERIKIPELVEQLNAVFSTFGDIKEIIAKKSIKRKGQAFIVYDTVDSAEMAIETLQGFEIFGRSMRLEFAKTRSDFTVRNEDGEAAYKEHKTKRIADREQRDALDEAKAAEAKSKKRAREADAAAEPAAKQAKSNAAAKVVPDEYLPPNAILTVRDIPDGLTKDEVIAVFGRFPGFKDARLPPGRPLAYVEYVDAQAATVAKNGLVDASIRDHKLRISFRRAAAG